MKRILLALAIFALVLPATRQAEAQGDLSIDFFYNNLGPSEGNWVEVADYGYCWQPNVAVSNHAWRPYTEGRWAYTDVGWTWVSNEKFGWATYHYGRWARLRDQGWVWVPGREWAPAWVSWRTGGDHVGWAPLPPRRESGGEPVYEGRSVNAQVDVEYDIGPAYYNFVDIRYLGAPTLRERIIAPDRNVSYITETVNVTNITYKDSRVYNYGPDYDRMSAYSAQPIERLTIQRESGAQFTAAEQSGTFTRVQGNNLMVAAPQQFKQFDRKTAPKTVKAKFDKPDLETGWSGVTDPKAKAELQQKIKAQDPKTIPPPKIQPTNPAALKAASPSPLTASPDGTPVKDAEPTPAAAVAPSTTPALSATPLGTATPMATPSPAATQDASPTTNGKNKAADRKKKNAEPTEKPSVTPSATETPATKATATPKADAKSRNIQHAPKQLGTPVQAPTAETPALKKAEGNPVKEKKSTPAKTEATPMAKEKSDSSSSEKKSEKIAQPRERKADHSNKSMDMSPPAKAQVQDNTAPVPIAAKNAHIPAQKPETAPANKPAEKKHGKEKEKDSVEPTPLPAPGQ